MDVFFNFSSSNPRTKTQSRNWEKYRRTTEIGNSVIQDQWSEMAEHLASIFGTEKDRVNCPFYFKIGACRHGDRCSRLHTKPSISPTLLLSNMYLRPDMLTTPGVEPQGDALDPRKIQDNFEVKQYILI